MLDNFKNRCIEKFGDKYIFDKSIYKSNREHFIVTCPIHGDFRTKTVYFDKVSDICPKCSMRGKNSHGWSKTRWIEICRNRTPTLYLLKFSNKNESFYKIGITLQTIKRRFHTKMYANYKIEEILLLKDTGKIIWELEKLFIKKYKQFKYNPMEEFQGISECFNFDDIQSIIKQWKEVYDYYKSLQ